MDPNVEIPWLRLVSTFEANYFVVLIWIHFLQFDIFAIALPISIKNCLRLCRPSWKPEITRPCSFKGPEICLTLYTKLECLVSRFNIIYSNYVLALKFCYLISLCLLFYLPIRHHSEIFQYFLLSFIIIIVTILSRVAEVLLVMGSVEREAAVFKDCWTCALGQSLVVSNTSAFKDSSCTKDSVPWWPILRYQFINHSHIFFHCNFLYHCGSPDWNS